MPPVASTAAQAIFEGLHEDASRSGRTDARLCIRRAHTQHACACCACAGQHVRQSVSQVSQFRRGPPRSPHHRLKGRLRSPRSTHVRAGPWCIDPEHFVLDTSARIGRRLQACNGSWGSASEPSGFGCILVRSKTPRVELAAYSCRTTAQRSRSPGRVEPRNCPQRAWPRGFSLRRPNLRLRDHVHGHRRCPG